jgi:hypothetical protein
VLRNIKKKGLTAKVEEKQTNQSNKVGKDRGHFTTTSDKKGGEIFAFLYFLILYNIYFQGNTYSDKQKAALNTKR